MFRHGRIHHGLAPASILQGWRVPSSPCPCARDWGKPRKSRMGAAPIVIFRGLPQSRAQGHGELGTPHFPGYTPAWYNPKLNHLYI